MQPTRKQNIASRFLLGDLELVQSFGTTLIGRSLLDNYKQKQTFSSGTTYLVNLIVDVL